MPIRQNRYYNDPNIGAAFDNLAGLFAPPDGGDAAGWAQAAAVREEAKRKAELFNYAQSPNLRTDVFDRSNIAIGNYNPTQSYYAQDQNNAATLRSQDISRMSAYEVARLKEQGDTIRQMFNPLKMGEVRPGMPKAIADFYSVPDVFSDPAYGNISANPGERILTPDGRMVEGAPKPLSKTEYEAQILAGLTPQEQRAEVLDDNPVEVIMTPEGPQFVRRSDAVGQSPAPKEASAEVKNYIVESTGQRGIARIVNGQVVDQSTGKPLPPDATLYSGQLNASSADALSPTASNRTAANKIEANVASGRSLVNQLRAIIKSNPGSAGVAADFKSFIQDIGQVAKDFSQQFGNDPNAKVTIDQARAMIDRVMPADAPYDPTYRQVNTLMFELAYRMAQSLNPSGEVAVKALEMTLQNLGLGLTGNDQSVLAALQSYEDQLNRNEVEARKMRDPSWTPDNATTGGVEEWERDPVSGKLRRKGATNAP